MQQQFKQPCAHSPFKPNCNWEDFKMQYRNVVMQSRGKKKEINKPNKTTNQPTKPQSTHKSILQPVLFLVFWFLLYLALCFSLKFSERGSDLFLYLESISSSFWTEPHISTQVKCQSPRKCCSPPTQRSFPESQYLHFTLSGTTLATRGVIFNKYIFSCK